MKIAKFKRYKYIDNKREMYSIWLQMHDGETEQFHGFIINYRVRGWERHTINLILDSMKVVLTLAGYEVIGDA